MHLAQGPVNFTFVSVCFPRVADIRQPLLVKAPLVRRRSEIASMSTPHSSEQPSSQRNSVPPKLKLTWIAFEACEQFKRRADRLFSRGPKCSGYLLNQLAEA